MLLKSQQRFKSVKRNVFTEENNKIALSLNDDKRMQSIDSIETYLHGMSEDIIWKQEKISNVSIIIRISIMRNYKNVYF